MARAPFDWKGTLVCLVVVALLAIAVFKGCGCADLFRPIAMASEGRL